MTFNLVFIHTCLIYFCTAYCHALVTLFLISISPLSLSITLRKKNKQTKKTPQMSTVNTQLSFYIYSESYNSHILLANHHGFFYAYMMNDICNRVCFKKNFKFKKLTICVSCKWIYKNHTTWSRCLPALWNDLMARRSFWKM